MAQLLSSVIMYSWTFYHWTFYHIAKARFILIQCSFYLTPFRHPYFKWRNLVEMLEILTFCWLCPSKRTVTLSLSAVTVVCWYCLQTIHMKCHTLGRRFSWNVNCFCLEKKMGKIGVTQVLGSKGIYISSFLFLYKQFFFIKETDTFGHIVVWKIFTSTFTPQHTAFE